MHSYLLLQSLYCLHKWYHCCLQQAAHIVQMAFMQLISKACGAIHNGSPRVEGSIKLCAQHF